MKKFILTSLMAACALFATAQNTEQRITFQGVVDILKAVAGKWTPAPQPLVEASGLHLASYTCYEEEDVSLYEIVYTHHSNPQLAIGSDSIPYYKYTMEGPNACALKIEAYTSSGATISFTEEADYNRFMKEALTYGLLQLDGSDLSYYYVNETPLEGGGLVMTSPNLLFPSSPDTDKAFYQPIILLSAASKDETGWYTYYLNLDF